MFPTPRRALFTTNAIMGALERKGKGGRYTLDRVSMGLMACRIPDDSSSARRIVAGLHGLGHISTPKGKGLLPGPD